MWVLLCSTPGSTRHRQNARSKTRSSWKKSPTKFSPNLQSNRATFWDVWIFRGLDFPSQCYKGQARECCALERGTSKALHSQGKPVTVESPGTATHFSV